MGAQYICHVNESGLNVKIDLKYSSQTAQKFFKYEVSEVSHPEEKLFLSVPDSDDLFWVWFCYLDYLKYGQLGEKQMMILIIHGVSVF